MVSNWVRRVLSPVVQFRESEFATGLMMFAYSFLAMTAYNVVKPITRSKFISSLGADNLPYVQLAAGLLIGVLMQGYSVLVARLPRRYVAPLTLAGMSGLLVAFWFLFRTAGDWVSVAFYLLGLILGLLLISQFWTLANDIYDARQAKRVFGFIGGGSSLGGMTGAGLTALVVSRVGTENLLLCSAAILLLCAGLVALIVRREAAAGRGGAVAAEEEGVGGKEAFRLLRESRHLQIIALVIAFAAVGAGLIEQQLNMAAEAFKGRSATDNLTEFLAQVTLYLSAIGFFIQVALTSRIHRYLGVGFALLVLPTSLGVTGVVMLLNAALWAPALARILDTSLRYTLDKTTREVLFLPLPTALKYRAKPFVDVTVDRFAKGLAALLALVLIKPWGLGLNWQQISYASLAVMAPVGVHRRPRAARVPRHLPPQHRDGGRSRPRRRGPTSPTPRRWRRWSRRLARILDTSLRYTLDKTTREVLFLPLPTALKYRAKPFVDVTVDRFAKGLAALLALVLIKPWGLGLNWQQISYASLAVMAPVGGHRRARAARVPGHLPPQHRAAGGRRRRRRGPTSPIPRRWRPSSRSSRTPTRGGCSTPSSCSRP